MYINSYGRLCSDDYLAHHGILGQKYGVRNGPPYPLGASAHSAAEKKAGWRKSLSTSKTRYGSQGSSKDSTSVKKPKEKKDSDNSSAAFFLARMALDIVGFRPIRLAMDTKRLMDYGQSKVKQALENKRVSKLEVDKKTGFHLKNKEMTPEEDMKHINPGYKNFNANTKNNCMLCTTAYELRRRGYDVQAGISTKGYQYKNVEEWFPKAKVKNIYSPDRSDKKQLSKEGVKAVLGISGKEKFQKLSESLLKHGDGARGNLMVSWNLKGGGHSIVWENQNGRVILRDCQSGKKYTSDRQIASLLSKTVDAQYARTDNVDFDERKLKGLIR